MVEAPSAGQVQPRGIAPTATPAEAQRILAETKVAIDKANAPADTFALERETPPPPSKRELEVEAGQGSIFEEPKPTTPLEDLLKKKTVDLSKEQAEVRQAVQPIEAQMREVTGKTAPETALEHERGKIFAPPDTNRIWVRVDEAHRGTDVTKSLHQRGWLIRHEAGVPKAERRWFKEVTPETRQAAIDEATELLGARVERPLTAPVSLAAKAPAPPVPIEVKPQAPPTPIMGRPAPRPDERPLVPGQTLGRQLPPSPEAQEWANLITAGLQGAPIPDAPLVAERQIATAMKAAERLKALVRSAVGKKTGSGLVELLERPKPREFTPQELVAAVQMQRAVDDFTAKLRRNPARASDAEAFPEPETPIRPPMEEQYRQAREREALLEEGTPEALQKYGQMLRELQDREHAMIVRNAFSEEKAAMPPRKPGGEFTTGSGFGPLAGLYERDPKAFWRLMARTSGTLLGGAIGSGEEPDAPVAGFIKGALAGWMLTSPKLYRKATYRQLGRWAKAVGGGGPKQTVGGRPALRLMPDAEKDISLFTRLRPGTVENMVPELHRPVWEILNEYAQAVKSGALRDVTPAQQAAAHRFYYKDASKEAYEMAAEYAEKGLKNKAAIARNLGDSLVRKPTRLQTAWKKGMESLRFDVNYDTIERVFGTSVYRIGIGWALDSPLANATQPILALRHVSIPDLLHGWRMARTPEGITASSHLHISRPVDVDLEGMPIVPPAPKTVGEHVGRLATDPGRLMGVGDNYNRRVVYLAAMKRAQQKMGLDPIKADDWAQEVVRVSQGDVGAMGFNPTYRGPIGGTLRPYQKFPALLLENLFDTLAQPNKVTAGTFIATLAGLDYLGHKVGLDLGDMILMGGRPLGLDMSDPVGSIEKVFTGQTTPLGRFFTDVSRHVSGTATHGMVPGLDVPFTEDEALNSDIAALVGGRWPVKAIATADRFARYGTGAHLKRTPTGAPEPVTALEDLLNLFNMKTPRQTAQQEFIQQAQADVAKESTGARFNRTQLQRLYASAIDRGDIAEASRLLGELKSIGSAKAMVKRLQTDRYHRLLQSMSPELREPFEKLYGERYRETQIPR